ncbi:MAG: DUF47 domain-containing protein [Crocinitomicaceae bacterium]|nr:DUF47 domain-containing protein [Crocinitomicaceae bacterium]
MRLSSLMSIFTPKGSLFFRLFAEDAANLSLMGKALNELMRTNDPDKRAEWIRHIADLEHKGDEITHEIFIELGSNFITPFDREDIHELATALDDIADYIHGTATRIELYGIGEFTGSMKKMADIIEQLTNEVQMAVTLLENLKNPEKIREAIVRVNSLENHADDVFDEAIARLFSEYTDAVQLIKEKEILANMETATDMCEDVANVIETILVKNS